MWIRGADDRFVEFPWVTARLANLATPDLVEEFSILVDPHATLSWIPRTILDKLGVKAVSQLPFIVADDQPSIIRDAGAVLLTLEGRVGPVPVAFAEAKDQAFLGGTALEILGLVADPAMKKLATRHLRA